MINLDWHANVICSTIMLDKHFSGEFHTCHILNSKGKRVGIYFLIMFFSPMKNCGKIYLA